MKSIKLKKIILYLVLFISQKSLSNDIQLSNISLTGQNTSTDFTMVQFDLTWGNSWRISTGPSNWDAAWVFVKYRVGSGPWLHAFLNENGHIAGSGTAASITPGLMITSNAFHSTSNPAMGVFVHRSGNGAGTFTQTGLKLRWNYGANSVTDGQAVDIKVFAVEMVYVQGASFQVGETTISTLQGQFRNGSTNTPFTISSEAQLTLGGTVNGNLANNTGMLAEIDDFNSSTTQILPAVFPKGFNAFYCMKYEISQQQWIDFFNTLDVNQKNTRDITGGTYNTTGKNSDLIINRNNISWSSGDAILNGGTFGNVGCNFLSWMDVAAYADWASLRPMSELEFEKACRGTLTPVANEFAWGSSTIHASSYASLSNPGAANELPNAPSTTNGNAAYTSTANISGIQGPLRVGSFATASSTRVQAGASYYGIMELSGNLWERTVSVGNVKGREFTAPLHGNGLLTSNGFCDIASWPGYVAGEVTGAIGSGFRGGSWNVANILLQTSNRERASVVGTNRFHHQGFHGVRLAP